MPTFETPEPIHVDLNLVLGNVTIAATDRTDTVVTVNPTNPDNEADTKAVAETEAELVGNTVRIKGLKLRKYIGPTKNSPSVDISIELPTGSSLSAKGFGSMVGLTTTGRLGACEFSTGMGRLTVEEAGPVKLRTTGDIIIDRAHGDVEASTAQGAIRIGEVSEGIVDVKTSMGDVEVGIPGGTAALLDVQTSMGTLRNQLDDTGEPGPKERSVKVRARTSMGDIEIRRS